MKQRHIFVRPSRTSDAKDFVEWSKNTPNNLFDPDVVKYPTTVVRCAFDSSGVIVYAPIQQPLFIDALAINPNRDEIAVATGLKEITQDAVSQAYIKGAGEIYFVCADERTAQFAERQAYKKMPWNVYRIKLSELEKTTISK